MNLMAKSSIWVVKHRNTESDSHSNIVLFSTKTAALGWLKENAPPNVFQAIKKDEWFEEETDENEVLWALGEYRVER